jgi:hypothetical protein
MLLNTGPKVGLRAASTGSPDGLCQQSRARPASVSPLLIGDLQRQSVDSLDRLQQTSVALDLFATGPPTHEQAIPSAHGLLTTLSFKLGPSHPTHYALEGKCSCCVLQTCVWPCDKISPSAGDKHNAMLKQPCFLMSPAKTLGSLLNSWFALHVLTLHGDQLQ